MIRNFPSCLSCKSCPFSLMGGIDSILGFTLDRSYRMIHGFLSCLSCKSCPFSIKDSIPWF